MASIKETVAGGTSTAVYSGIDTVHISGAEWRESPIFDSSDDDPLPTMSIVVLPALPPSPSAQTSESSTSSVAACGPKPVEPTSGGESSDAVDESPLYKIIAVAAANACPRRGTGRCPTASAAYTTLSNWMAASPCGNCWAYMANAVQQLNALFKPIKSIDSEVEDDDAHSGNSCCDQAEDDEQMDQDRSGDGTDDESNDDKEEFYNDSNECNSETDQAGEGAATSSITAAAAASASSNDDDDEDTMWSSQHLRKRARRSEAAQAATSQL